MLRILYFVTIFLIVFNYNILAQPQIEIQIEKSLEIELKKDYNYELFKINDKYLVWFEFYEGMLTIYDLTSRTSEEVNLNKGRGPGEYLAISDLVLANNEIYLLDPNNIKLIKVGIENKAINDINLSNFTPMKMIGFNNNLLMMEINQPDEFFYFFNIKEDKYSSFDLGNLNLMKEFPNGFYRNGTQMTKGKKLFHITKYLPNIYVFNTEELEFIQKIEFDKTSVEVEKAKEIDGAKVTSPPSKVDVLIEDAVALDAKSNSIFFLAQGKSDDREYHLNELHEYDFVNQEFVDTHHLKIEATNIFSNDNTLFVYSEEENAIFQYQLNQDK